MTDQRTIDRLIAHLRARTRARLSSARGSRPTPKAGIRLSAVIDPHFRSPPATRGSGAREREGIQAPARSRFAYARMA